MNTDELKFKLEEAKKIEETGDYFSASFYYKEVIEIARKLNDSATIIFCKNKIVEMNKKSDSAFSEISFEQKISNKLIDKIVDPIIDGEIEDILKNIGVNPNLLPNFEHIKISAQDTIPLTYQIASVSAISEDGHLIRGGEDGGTAWGMRMYSINQGLISELYLSKVFKVLKEKGLDRQRLIKYFTKTGIFPEENIKIISIAIDRYFNEDYISALHILIPQFENIFLYVSEKSGIDIVSLNRTKEISTQLKTLSSEYLSSIPFQEKWGVDFCEQIKFVFFEPLGYTLRHRVAHGQITEKECNLSNANLVLYFYLVLSARVGIKSN